MLVTLNWIQDVPANAQPQVDFWLRFAATRYSLTRRMPDGIPTLEIAMANWTIRKAKQEDATALADCIDAAYAVYNGRITDLPAVSDGIADDISDNWVWVAETEDRIIGGIVIVPKNDHIVVANVAVDPGATGAGLGRALMDLAEAEAHRAGIETLRLSTHTGIPENVRLYQHLGWHEIERSGNKVKMAKLLTAQ